MASPPESIELRADGRLFRFSSNLLNFLAGREGGPRFHLGDWLQSLDEAMLGHLQQLAEAALHDPQAIGSGRCQVRCRIFSFDFVSIPAFSDGQICSD